MSSVRLFGQISRLISKGPSPSASCSSSSSSSGLLGVAVATSIKTLNRPLYNQPTWTTASNQQQATTSSHRTSRIAAVGQPPVAPAVPETTPKNLFSGSITELDYKLDEIKVFQDEQIIQLVFKSGQTVNYTMNWLRNLCPCSECMSNKFQSRPNQPRKLSDNSGQWSVARIRCNSEDELEIEWLDNEQYHSHASCYNLKYLSIYGQSDPRTSSNFQRI